MRHFCKGAGIKSAYFTISLSFLKILNFAIYFAKQLLYNKDAKIKNGSFFMNYISEYSDIFKNAVYGGVESTLKLFEICPLNFLFLITSFNKLAKFG